MISIITPTHKTSSPYLPEAYDSVVAQTHTDWEWVIVTNAGGSVPPNIENDARVNVYPIEDDFSSCPEGQERNSIGRLKKFAAQQAKGDIIVELDADDLLTPNALESIHAAFEDNGVAMVYSNSADFRNNTWESEGYSDYWGWRNRPFFYQGHELKEMIAWPPSVHMMRMIFWAPNHVRAWRTAAYWKVEGHSDMPLADDHDLCCRLYIQYGAAGFRHIDECLYLYRTHDHNSCRVFNDGVQEGTLANYLKYSRQMIIRWVKDEGLRLLDLGGRFDARSGFETVDLLDADIITDLEQRWPFEDNSVGVIRASHIFEHLHDPVHTMNEAFRVLAPGGWLLIEVPSTDGRGAFQDPTHVTFWNENSMWYYTDKRYSRYIQPAYTGRFQVSRVVTYFPTDFEKLHNIPIVQADLIALKHPYDVRPVGEVLI